MSELVRWGDIAFYVSPAGVRGIKEIAIEAGSETEDSTVDGEKFVKRKNGNPYSISMTAILDARLGESVQSVATQMTEAARCSRTGYFYTGGGKLFPSQFMMVSAKISDIELNPGGRWLRCEVTMTLKQASKFDGSTSSAATSNSGSSGGSSGTSSSKVSTKTQSATASNIQLGYGPITDSYAETIKANDAAAKEAAKPKVTDSMLRTTTTKTSSASAGLQAMANAVVNQAKTQSQKVTAKATTAAKTTSKTTTSKISTASSVKKNTKVSVN